MLWEKLSRSSIGISKSTKYKNIQFRQYFQSIFDANKKMKYLPTM